MRKYIYVLIAILISILIILLYQNNKLKLTNNAISVACFNEKSEKSIDYLEIGDKILCNILYQNNHDINTISYLLDYGSGIDIIESDLTRNDGFYTINIDNFNGSDVLHKIAYQVNENANSTNIYIALRNISVTVKNKKYFIEEDYFYNLKQYFGKKKRTIASSF